MEGHCCRQKSQCPWINALDVSSQCVTVCNEISYFLPDTNRLHSCYFCSLNRLHIENGRRKQSVLIANDRWASPTYRSTCGVSRLSNAHRTHERGSALVANDNGIDQILTWMILTTSDALLLKHPSVAVVVSLAVRCFARRYSGSWIHEIIRARITEMMNSSSRLVGPRHLDWRLACTH